MKRISFQYYRDLLALDNTGAFIDFTEANVTDSFNLKVNIAAQTGDNSKNSFEVKGPLKSLLNFLRTFELSSINCETDLI